MSQITVSKEGQRWIARFPYDFATKEHVKGAGFRWDPQARYWWTTDAMVAAKLDGAAAATANQQISASRAVTAQAEVAVPDGLAYLPYQLAGIATMRTRANVLLADEMGLGKTIQVIGLLNDDPSIKRVLIVCPASLKANWVRELNKWLVRPRQIAVANGQFPDAEIVVINYDILGKHRATLMAVTWDLLVADESQYLKNEKAQRTQALLGQWTKDKADRMLPVQAKRKVFLTGTPIVNRPRELWTTVKALDPNGLGSGNFPKFGVRYCDGHQVAINRRGDLRWDFDGASNLEELQQRLRSSIMIRRLKADVLTELPAKRRQVIVVPPNSALARAAVQAERVLFDRYQQAIVAAEKAAAAARARGDNDGYRAAVDKLHSASKIAFDEMAKVRHETAVAKLDAVIEHLELVLESQDKVVVFCHHHDVARALAERFANAAVVTGEVAPKDRIDQVDKFQHDPDCHLFVGSIQAAGVGLTLTAAQHVVFAEMDWVPGNMSQAEDRLHRIGQRGHVLVQHLVFDNSVDSLMAHIIIDKQEVIEAAMDKPVHAVRAPQPQPVDQVEEPEVTRVRDINRPADDSEIPF